MMKHLDRIQTILDRFQTNFRQILRWNLDGIQTEFRRNLDGIQTEFRLNLDGIQTEYRQNLDIIKT